jgi:tape measure domain-containing protein
MSAIGDLVVNLVARTKQFTSPIRDAMGSLSELSDTASARLSEIAASATNVSLAAGVTSGAIYGIAAATQAVGGSASVLMTLVSLFGFVAKAAGGVAIATGGISLLLSRIGPQATVLDRLAAILGRVATGAAVLRVGLGLVSFAMQKLGRDTTRIDAVSKSLGQISIAAVGVQVALRAASLAGRAFVTVISAPVRVAIATWRAFVGVARSVASALGAVAGAAARAAAAIGSTAAMVTGAMSPALMMLAGPLTAASVGLVGIGGLAWGAKLAIQAEQAEVAFTTMLRSSSAAKSMLADLSKFAADTPYESPEVIDAAKQLLAYGVEADRIQGTLRMLGDVASGVSAPLGDIAYLFGTAKTQGRLFAMDINQLTNRGIPIIKALAATMGVAQSSVKELVSEGKVGFPELQGAFKYLTKEGGQFSGMMSAQSKTMAGLWSAFKDNLGMTLRQIAEQLMAAFGVKDLMANAVAGLELVKAGAISLGPHIYEIGRIARAVFDNMLLLGQTVLSTLGGLFGSSSQNWSANLLYVLQVVRVLAENIPLLLEAAFLSAGLYLVAFGESFKFIFTTQIPALLNWLAGMMTKTFTAIVTWKMTLFENLFRAIRSGFSSLWAWIQSGFRSELKVDWGHLMSGFKAAVVDQMPDIPERALSNLELSLAERANDAWSTLNDKFKNIESAMPKTPDVDALASPITPPTTIDEDGEEEGGKEKAAGPNFAGALTRGSQEAMSAINRAMAGGSPQKKLEEQSVAQTKLQQEMVSLLKGLQGEGVDYGGETVDFGWA